MNGERVKYPRTRHLPGSPGASSDDVFVTHLSALAAGEVVVTEKMDGENTTIGRGYVHARSLESAPHPSRDWVRALAGRLAHEIPPGMRICGENLYARHSIGYDALPSYFLVFSVWQDDVCLDWDGTGEWVELLGLHRVPVLHRGPFHGVDDLLARWRAAHHEDRSEGFVVRSTRSFRYADFGTHVAKWVRSDHVRTDRHWMAAEVTPNGLAG